MTAKAWRDVLVEMFELARNGLLNQSEHTFRIPLEAVLWYDYSSSANQAEFFFAHGRPSIVRFWVPDR